MCSYVKGAKKCRTCGGIKDYRSFYKASGNTDGYENQCKLCKSNSRDPETRRTFVKQWRAKRVEEGFYGYCDSCKEPLGRNENGRKSPYCRDCAKGYKHPNFSGGYLNRDGYRIVFGKLEHRVVMEEFLGRKLEKDENVHHINGVKTDNRLQNLELWNTSQPSGQRIADKVRWAREILERYT